MLGAIRLNSGFAASTGAALIMLAGGAFGATQFAAVTAYTPPPGLVSRPAVGVVADFDGDGHPDLAVGGAGIAVMYGPVNASPAWSSTSRPITTTDLIAGDMDGDGRPDLVFATVAGVFVQLSRGRSFTEPRQISSATGLLAGGDLNGDGRADLLISGADLILLLSTGSGDYITITVGAALSQSTYGGGAIADFDGDGRMDLAVLRPQNGQLLIYPGNGDGSLRTPIATAAGCSRLSAGDLNGDGRLDLLLFGGCRGQVLLGSGSGHFTGGPPFAGNSALFVERAVLADLNGDGRLDVIATHTVYNVISLHYGRGDASFDGPVYRETGPGLRATAAADFDEDGSLDLAVVNDAGSVEIQITTQGSDGLSYRTARFPLTTTLTGLAAGDFNGDNIPDLAAIDSASQTVRILLGRGDGTFRDGSQFPTDQFPTTILVADFNLDGEPDLAVSARYTVEIFLGSADGTFVTAGRNGLWVSTDRLTAVDLNHDGFPDLIAGGPVSCCLTRIAAGVYLGRGDGTFSSNYGLPSDSGRAATFPLSFVDLTGDGIPDLVAEHLEVIDFDLVTDIRVYRGRGDGTFEPSSTVIPDQGAYFQNGWSWAVAADIDRDGRQDLLVFGSSSVRIFFGDAKGSLDNRLSIPLGGEDDYSVIGPRFVADWNGDGIPDLAAVITVCGKDSCELDLQLALGRGNRQFEVVPASLPNLPTTAFVSVVSADWNGDGKADLALLDYGSRLISLMNLGQ